MGWLRNIFGVGKLATSRVAVVWWLLRHPTVPRSAKLFVLGAVVYGVMPLDLVPDFIPALGQIDDVVLVPALILVALAKVIHATLERYGLRERDVNAANRARAWSTDGLRVEASVRGVDEDPVSHRPVDGYVVQQEV